MSDERDQAYQNSPLVTHLQVEAQSFVARSATLLHRTIGRSCNKQQTSRALSRSFDLWEAERFVRLPALLEGGFVSCCGYRTKIQLPQPDICQTLRPPTCELAIAKYESSQCLTISTHAATRKTGV
jgi:hypothetical protein